MTKYGFASHLFCDTMHQMACWKFGWIPVQQPLFKLIVTAHSKEKNVVFKWLIWTQRGVKNYSVLCA